MATIITDYSLGAGKRSPEPSDEDRLGAKPGFAAWAIKVNKYVDDEVIRFCADYDKRVFALSGRSDRLMDSAVHQPLKDIFTYLTNWNAFPDNAVTNNSLARIVSSFYKQADYNIALLPDLLNAFAGQIDTVYVPLMEQTVVGWKTMNGDERALTILGASVIGAAFRSTAPAPKVPWQPRG